MSGALISFVGAGPGAPDLLTVRGVQRLAGADVVVWAASLVPEEVLSHCRPDVELFDSKSMTLEEVTAVYAEHPEAAIVRLHSGDPTVYSAVAEQIAWCIAQDRAYEIVPGVSSLAATAAAAGCELTVPGVSQTVVLTRLAARTTASVPHDDHGVAAAARLGATMAVFLSAARPEALQEELLAPGSRYTAETPALIAHRVSRPDEAFVPTTVGRLAADMRALGATTTVLVLVGDALNGAHPDVRSHVYASDYSHSFRNADRP
jgi:precorrin-4/cobalt-precorrin-4 C11-methyltransferase